MSRCPSDLELESLARTPDGGAAHAGACPRCAARLEELRRLGEEFVREVFPATVDAVLARAGRAPARPRLRWLLPAVPLAAAAAAAVVLVVRPALRGEESDGPPTLAVAAFAQVAGEARPLAEGAAVPPEAGLRFEVHPGRSCKILIVAADAEGGVSRVYPAVGEEGTRVKGGTTLAVAAAGPLAGAPGPQRLFVACGCGDEPVYMSDLLKAAQGVGAGEGRVRDARTLQGLPDDALQATLLVEKAR